MEGYLFKWLNFIKGWKARFIILEDNLLIISKKKGEEKKEVVDLNDAKIIDEKKKKYFFIETSKKKLYFKTENEDQKQSWLKVLNEHKNKLLNENYPFDKKTNSPSKPVQEQVVDGRFSLAYKAYSQEINKQNAAAPLDNIVKNLLNIQNLIFEFTYCIDDYKLNINQKTINKDELFKTHEGLYNIKNEMKVVLINLGAIESLHEECGRLQRL
jgi:hypothetical protein